MKIGLNLSFAEQRRVSLQFFKRAVDMTLVMEADCIGTPLGGMSHEDAEDEGRRKAIYSEVLDLVGEPATYAKAAGLKKILVEPTPLSTEFPSDPRGSLQLICGTWKGRRSLCGSLSTGGMCCLNRCSRSRRIWQSGLQRTSPTSSWSRAPTSF